MLLRETLPAWLRDHLDRVNPNPSHDTTYAIIEIARVVDMIANHTPPPVQLAAPDPDPKLDEYKRAIDSLSAHLDEERRASVRRSEIIDEVRTILGVKAGELLVDAAARVVAERDKLREEANRLATWRTSRAGENVRAPENVGDDLERHQCVVFLGPSKGVQITPPAEPLEPVYFVRFGVDANATPARPTYNHTRGDSLYDPCPECAALQSRAELHLRIRDLNDRIRDLEQQNRELLAKDAATARAAALSGKAA